MRGRWSLFLLPIIVLNLLLITIISSYPHHQMAPSQRISSVEVIDWTSVERVSRSLTRDEIEEEHERQRYQVALVSKEEEDFNSVADDGMPSKPKKLSPVETEMSKEEILKQSREAFGL